MFLRNLMHLIIVSFLYTIPLKVSVADQELVEQIDYILVEKEKRTLSVFHHKKLLKVYKIALGSNPVGHKQQEGDGRTPEGIYKISLKNPKSSFYLSLKISYPNEQDQKSAQMRGVSPGGDIFIHGLRFGVIGALHRHWDWTQGCIALTNEEIQEVFAATEVGTIVEIRS